MLIIPKEKQITDVCAHGHARAQRSTQVSEDACLLVIKLVRFLSSTRLGQGG
jgi:hypothetical protein